MAFITAGLEPIEPASPAPLMPSGLVLHGTLRVSKTKVGHIVGARQRIVHEARGEQLADRASKTVSLHQRLADALRDPAMHLAGEQQRIERDAEVVDHDIADDRGHAGVGIDLDLGDVRAVRIGRRLGARIRPPRSACSGVALGCAARSAKEIDAVGAGDAHGAVGDLEVAAAASSSSAASSLSCSASVLRGAVDRHAADGNRARAAGAAAGRDRGRCRPARRERAPAADPSCSATNCA